MNTNNDINTLGNLWRSLDDNSVPARPVADISRRRRAQRIYLVVETGIALAGSAIGLILISTGNAAIGMAALIFSLLGGMIGWVTRSMNINVLERSVSEHFEATTSVLKAKRNHNIGGVAMFVAAFLFTGFVRWQANTGLSLADLIILAGLFAAAVFYLFRARRVADTLARSRVQAELWKDEQETGS